MRDRWSAAPVDFDRPMRIALLGYRNERWVGGQGKYSHALANGLARLGHTVRVFAPGEHLGDSAYSHTRVDTLDLYRSDESILAGPTWATMRSPLDAVEGVLFSTGVYAEPLAFSLRCIGQVRSFSPDVIHDNQGLGYGLLLLRRVARCPVISTIHHLSREDRAVVGLAKNREFGHRFYNFVLMQERVARRLDHLVVVSKRTADSVEQLGVPRERMTVVAPPIDFGPRPPIADEEKRRRSGLRILSVLSRANSLKGVDRIASTARLLTDWSVDFSWQVVGPEDSAAKIASVEPGVLDRFRFDSNLSQRELWDTYQRADVVVVASRVEGLCMPLLEAWAHETPVVSTAVGVAPELFERFGMCSYLATGDVESLATAIVRSMGDAPELRLRVQLAARYVRETYGAGRAAREMLDVYASLQH